MKKENIWNAPNALTLLRIALIPVIIYLIFRGVNIWYIIALFVFGMFTDLLDGQIARRFNLKTEFGRKFDMIADRLFMALILITILVVFISKGLFTNFHLIQIGMILPREILGIPFALISLKKKDFVPHANFFGKATTFMQTIVFSLIILSVYYPVLRFSIYLSAVTCVLSFVSLSYYIKFSLK